MDFTDFMNSTNSHPLTALDNSLSLSATLKTKKNNQKKPALRARML